MPSDALFKTVNTLHRTLLKLSGGRLGSEAWGMPMLELTTTGAKSGQRRSVMLSSPRQEGDAIMIVASRGGDPQNPAWFHNILANPDVQVALKGGKARPMRARVADADERARLWPLITADHDNYAGYQRKTDREIPVVILEPV